MSLLIVGSIAFDTVKTPFGKANKVLGGSAIYASLSSSYFVKPSVVGVVGKDFPKKYIKLLNNHNIDTSGIEVLEGKTFHWKGSYSFDLNVANTICTELNVFKKFNPILNKNFRNKKYAFLGNIDPQLQYNIYKQLKKPKIVACDTMNFWIKNKNKHLKELLKFVDILFLNEAEARQLSEQHNIIKAAKIIKRFGTKILVIKRGEYGCVCFYNEKIFITPSYPLEDVLDPTGAGDSFAGGFMGYLAKKNNLNENTLKEAIIYGTTMASFCIEDFSINRLYNLSFYEIKKRYKEILKLSKL